MSIKANLMNTFTKTLPIWFKNHKTGVLTGIGIGGLIFAGGWCIKATLDAKNAIDNYRDENGIAKDEKLGFWTIVKIGGKYYIVPLVAAVAGSLAIIFAHREDKKAISFAAAYIASNEAALQKTNEAIKDIVGDKKATEIREAAAQAVVDDNPPKADNTYANARYGTEVFFEPITGYYFTSDWQSIYNAIGRLLRDKDVDTDGTGYSFITIGEYLEALQTVGYPLVDIQKLTFASGFGWDNEHGMLEIRESPDATKTPEGKHCGAISFLNRPTKL